MGMPITQVTSENHMKTKTPETDEMASCECSERLILMNMTSLARRFELERRELYSAIRAAEVAYSYLSWGYDGDNGTMDMLTPLLDLLPENQ